MAMNKKEIAAHEAVLAELEIVSALRWTEHVAPDLPIPDAFRETSGWLPNAFSKRVAQKWSTRSFHGDGATRETSLGGSQNGIDLYSTELLALKALRHAVERIAAKDLAAIDKRIKAAQKGGVNE